MIENNVVNTTKSKGLYASIIVFLFTLVFTFWSYFYNLAINKSISNKKDEIISIDNNLEKLKSDSKIKLYTLINDNKVYLEKYRYLSNITDFISNFKDLSKKYNISFKNFVYSSSTISTVWQANDDSMSLASAKVQNFIKYFRDKNNDKFTMSFLNNFEWQENISFNINFKIK